MSARESILGKLRAARHAGAEESRDDRVAAAAVRERLGACAPPGPVPEVAARVAMFVEKAEAAAATTLRIPDLEALPAALGEALRARNIGASIRMGEEPVFAALDWAGIDASTGPGRPEEPATLSRAALGVAETGTLVLFSGADNPVTLALLGEAHFVVLREEDVVGNYEEIWARMRQDRLDPRSVNLITGPSRSADIEQKLELGAHGPGSVTIFLVGGGAG